MRFAAELLLAAMGTGDSEDEEQHAYAVSGAMMMAEGLFELYRIRKALTAKR